MTFRFINPLNSNYIDSKPSLYRACVNMDDAEFSDVERKLHGVNKKQVKSPAQQFDESHKRWLEGGRES